MDASAVVSGPTPVMPDVPGAAARPAQPLNLAAVAGAPALAQMQPVAAGNGNGGTGGDDRGRFAQAFAAADPGIVGALNGNRGAAAAVNPPVAANTGPTLEAPGSVADQVSGQLVRLVSGDSREMVMRLHPPDLGDLTVRVAVSGRDVQAWFESPQPQVQVAISQAIGQLHADLGSAGYSLNGAWVGADASNARRQGMAPPVPLPARDIAEPPGFGRAGAAAPRSSASGLNIYV
jgi:hypothetical protein